MSRFVSVREQITRNYTELGQGFRQTGASHEQATEVARKSAPAGYTRIAIEAASRGWHRG